MTGQHICGSWEREASRRAQGVAKGHWILQSLSLIIWTKSSAVLQSSNQVQQCFLEMFPSVLHCLRQESCGFRGNYQSTTWERNWLRKSIARMVTLVLAFKQGYLVPCSCHSQTRRPLVELVCAALFMLPCYPTHTHTLSLIRISGAHKRSDALVLVPTKPHFVVQDIRQRSTLTRHRMHLPSKGAPARQKLSTGLWLCASHISASRPLPQRHPQRSPA
jgi:hypothetical protein